MINNEITRWTQPVGSEIKGDKHGDWTKGKELKCLFLVYDVKCEGSSRNISIL